jgi:hypothetical protein
MTEEGPQLESLTHRLAECPPEFLLAPRVGGREAGTIDVLALVCDHFRALQAPVPGATAASLIGGSAPAVVPNRLRLTAVAAWLLRDPWFLARKDLADRTWELFATTLAEPAALLKAESTVLDPDRREELVRLCLRQLKLRPKGETIAQATDRLTALDSAEREKVIRKTRDAEARAREVREQMAKRAAEEAAAKTTRE